jgi:uncharacterized protein (DUF983 family)
MALNEPTTSALQAAIKGRCPRCGQGSLFRGPLTLSLRPACDRCGLDYAFIDTGDGPAVFAILLLGFLVLGAALIVEFKFEPPLWVHVLLWGPVTLVLAFGLLRLLKSVLVVLQFKHKAGEGRLESD